MKITKERKRYDGSLMREAIAVVGDQHGSVNFFLRDSQVDVVKEGTVITVRNAHANVKDEHLRLEVDKWAKVEPSSQEVGKVNTANNASDVEYERVYPSGSR